MAAQTGRPLNSALAPANRQQGNVSVLIDKYSASNLSVIVEVINTPTILRLYGANDGQQIRILTVFGPQDALQEQPYRPYGQDVYLSATANAQILRISGRYRLELIGTIQDIICTSEPLLVELGSVVPQPSGVQANRPNLFMGDNGEQLAESRIIEIIDTAWMFNAYGLVGEEEVTLWQVYDKGLVHREEVYRFNGGQIVLTSTRNAVKLNKSGRYKFVRTGPPTTNLLLVGNPTNTTSADELDIDSGGIIILGTYPSYAALVAAHPTGNLGDTYIVDGDLYVWNGAVWQNAGPFQGPPGTNGTNGVDGREVEIRNSGMFIQWRYVGDAAWLDVVSIEDITGPKGDDGSDGREVEIRNSGTFIQWRYVGDAVWLDIVALTTLKGDTGDQGPPGGPTIVISNAGNITLNAADHSGRLILQTGGVITLPETVAAGFIKDDIVEVRRQTSAPVTFVAGGSAVLDFNTTLYAAEIFAEKDIVGLKVIAVNTWMLVGALADAP